MLQSQYVGYPLEDDVSLVPVDCCGVLEVLFITISETVMPTALVNAPVSGSSLPKLRMYGVVFTKPI